VVPAISKTMSLILAIGNLKTIIKRN